MRFGILVPQTGPWPVLLERCLEVERLGYESLWIGDHYFLEPLPHFELFEAMTVLGGIAVSVPRVRFGAMTTNVIYRNPAVIAKQAATLDQMSGGRFELGLGAGVYETDHRMTGSAPWSPRERVDRFEEILAVVDPLLRGERVDHDGAHYQVVGGLVRPRPIQEPRPPITVGANGPRMVRIAAQRADRWNSWGGRGLSAEELWLATAERVRLFNDAVDTTGRDPGSVVRSLYVYRPLEPWSSPAALEAIVERARSIGLDELILAWPGFLQEEGAEAQIEMFRKVSHDLVPLLV